MARYHQLPTTAFGLVATILTFGVIPGPAPAQQPGWIQDEQILPPIQLPGYRTSMRPNYNGPPRSGLMLGGYAGYSYGPQATVYRQTQMIRRQSMRPRFGRVSARPIWNSTPSVIPAQPPVIYMNPR
jgi:hypothetical protein